jgi:3-oxoacyl-[acyl-carrier protein] reductase
MIDPGLDKKVALVTGANNPRGIGASIARALAGQGVSVFLSSCRRPAAELGKYGITVNFIAPGPVQTGWLRPDEEAEIGRKTPLGRVGRPDDIAGVVVFLASAQAGWLTGQLLYAGGGWKMSL